MMGHRKQVIRACRHARAWRIHTHGINQQFLADVSIGQYARDDGCTSRLTSRSLMGTSTSDRTLRRFPDLQGDDNGKSRLDIPMQSQQRLKTQMQRIQAAAISIAENR